MDKNAKHKVVEELADRLRNSETVIVADYRGLTMPQIDALRGRLLEHGARFSVVKNTLTRRAAEEAGAEALLALLEGPTAIAFLESGGDPVAVAKALADAARDTKILSIRGGVLEGRVLTAEEVETLSKLPSIDVVRGQTLGTIFSPIMTFIGLFNAPARTFVGLVEARADQLRAEGDTSEAAAPAAEPAAEAEPAAQAAEPETEEPAAEAQAEPPAAEVEAEAPADEAEPAEASEPTASTETTDTAAEDATASAAEDEEA
jgi:large subunit ribosomal protein L10